MIDVRGPEGGRRTSQGQVVELGVLQPPFVPREGPFVKLRHREPRGRALGAVHALARLWGLAQLRHVPQVLGHLVHHDLARGSRCVRVVCVGRLGLEPEHAADVIGDGPDPSSPRFYPFFNFGFTRGGRAGSREPRAVAVRIRRSRRFVTQLDLRRAAQPKLAAEDVGRRELRGGFIPGRRGDQVLCEGETGSSQRPHRVPVPPPELLPLHHQRHHQVQHGERHEHGVNLDFELHGVDLLLLRAAGIPGLRVTVRLRRDVTHHVARDLRRRRARPRAHLVNLAHRVARHERALQRALHRVDHPRGMLEHGGEVLKAGVRRNDVAGRQVQPVKGVSLDPRERLHRLAHVSAHRAAAVGILHGVVRRIVWVLADERRAATPVGPQHLERKVRGSRSE